MHNSLPHALPAQSNQSNFHPFSCKNAVQVVAFGATAQKSKFELNFQSHDSDGKNESFRLKKIHETKFLRLILEKLFIFRLHYKDYFYGIVSDMSAASDLHYQSAHHEKPCLKRNKDTICHTKQR